jgi:hypothetical protein
MTPFQGSDARKECLGFSKMIGYWLVFYAMVVTILGIIAAVVIAIMGRKVSP